MKCGSVNHVYFQGTLMNKRSIALMLFGWLLVIEGVLGALLQLGMLIVPAFADAVKTDLFGTGTGRQYYGALGLIVGLVFSTAILFGGISMIQARRLPLAIIGALASMMPCLLSG